MKELELRFGALSPKISDQLKEQGFRFIRDDAMKWEEFSRAINMLSIHGIIPESQIKAVRKRLFNMIRTRLKEWGNK